MTGFGPSVHMKTKHVVVVPYGKNWPTEFERIKQDLVIALGETAIGIEHVGSTSVEGLWAKPIIDIDVIIRDYSVFPDIVDKLASVGYRHEGDLGIGDCEAFRYDNKPGLMPHHLYVCPQASAELKRHIVFRNYLRNHPEDAAAYSEVKRRGAKLFPNDIDRYISYKSACIGEICKKCGLQV